MYYIASKFNNKFCVVDTKDGVQEFITPQELENYKAMGVQILTENITTYSDYVRLDNRMTYRLYKECCKDNAYDFLSNHALPYYDMGMATKGYIRTGIRKIFPYDATLGLFVLILELQSMKDEKIYNNIILSFSDGIRASKLIFDKGTVTLDKCCCGSGYYHERVDKRNYGLDDEKVYVRLQSSSTNDVSFVGIPDFNLVRGIH